MKYYADDPEERACILSGDYAEEKALQLAEQIAQEYNRLKDEAVPDAVDEVSYGRVIEYAKGSVSGLVPLYPEAVRPLVRRLGNAIEDLRKDSTRSFKEVSTELVGIAQMLRELES